MVRGVSQQGPRDFQVTVDDAGVATPDVVAAIDDAGGEVAYAREYRPSFDEVFAELVSRAREDVASARVDATGTARGDERAAPAKNATAPEAEPDTTMDDTAGEERR
jgi:hypothetical protein